MWSEQFLIVLRRGNILSPASSILSLTSRRARLSSNCVNAIETSARRVVPPFVEIIMSSAVIMISHQSVYTNFFGELYGARRTMKCRAFLRCISRYPCFLIRLDLMEKYTLRRRERFYFSKFLILCAYLDITVVIHVFRIM